MLDCSSSFLTELGLAARGGHGGPVDQGRGRAMGRMTRDSQREPETRDQEGPQGLLEYGGESREQQSQKGPSGA